MSDVDEGSGPERLWESRKVRWSAAAGILPATGFLLSPVGASDVLTPGIYVTATVVGVRFFALEGLEMLFQGRAIGIELVLTIAAPIAGVIGVWGEAASPAFPTRSPGRSRSSPRIA